MKYTVILFLAVVLSACSKEDSKNETSNEPRFSGVTMRDFSGVNLGCFGDVCSDDWVNSPLSALEIAHFDVPDSTKASGTSASTVANVLAYPNPLPINEPMFFSAKLDGAALFKMAIIDHWGRRQIAMVREVRDSDFTVLLPQIMFENLPKLKVHRIFFAFYNVEDEIIYSGYGDFGLCNQDSSTDPLTCFEQ